MATLRKDRNGNWQIVFMGRSGNRKCIQLGKIDKRSAEAILRHVTARCMRTYLGGLVLSTLRYLEKESHD